MAVQHLETAPMKEANQKFKQGIETFDECVTEMDNITSDVLKNWVGHGRNSFETQLKLMKGQLKDISGSLHGIYKDLVDAEVAYIDQDEQVAKQFSGIGEDFKQAKGE